jgi:hypothetical protein
MKRNIIYKGDCIGRVCVFGEREDLVFAPAETALFTSLAPIKAAFINAGAQQASGNRGFRETSVERGAAAIAARVLMRDIAEIAKALHERGVDMGAAEAFRMPRKGSYANLAAAAQAFVDLAEPRKALFTARGLAATFVEDLEALIAVLSTTGNQAGAKRASQVGGTAGLEIQANAGMTIVRELRAIMRLKLRPTPAILAEWKSIARVHAPVVDDDEEAPAPPSGDVGSGSISAS